MGQRKQIDDAAFVQMYNDGVAVADIFAHFGIGRTAFDNARRRLQLGNRHHGRRKVWDDHMFAEMYRRGDRVVDMCAYFGVVKTTVQANRDRLGLTKRPKGWRPSGYLERWRATQKLRKSLGLTGGTRR